MNKKIILWLVNCITGTFFSFGFVSVIYLCISAAQNTQYDRKMVTFLLITLFIGWMCSFIYHFNSKIAVTALLHGIIWFMLASISYITIFQLPIDISSLIKYMVLYGAIYWIGLSVIIAIGKKINTPFRHFNEFVAKLTQFILK